MADLIGQSGQFCKTKCVAVTKSLVAFGFSSTMNSLHLAVYPRILTSHVND